jgi:hypothetical protein
MGTKALRRFTGQFPGTGKTVTSSARCIVYDHKRDMMYLSTDNQALAIEVVRTQRERDKLGEYKAYELAGDRWHKIRVRLSIRPAHPRDLLPPMFLVCLGNAWSEAFSFLL